MKLSPSLVAVKKINSTLPSSKFSEDDLNRAAELILKAEGIINPLILRRTSQESYEVLDGHFEYYAAAKAREKDPLKGEMIGAFIIEPENQEVFKEQVKALRERETPDYEKQIQSLLQQLEKSFQDEVKTLIKKLDDVFSKQLEAIGYELDRTVKKTDYNSMTVAQLKAMARQREIKVPARPKKSDFIEALKKSEPSKSKL